MPSATRICKVCGKEYEYCHTLLRPGIFRWQDVACCREHGAEYLAEVMKSRGETEASSAEAGTHKQKATKANAKAAKEAVITLQNSESK